MTAPSRSRHSLLCLLTLGLVLAAFPFVTVGYGAESADDSRAPDGRLVVLWKHAQHGSIQAHPGLKEVRSERVSGGRLSLVVADPAQLTDVARALRGNPEIQAVVPDAIGAVTDWPLTAPTDPLYATSQADLPLINVPAAWKVTTGSPSVTVAIVDTGAALNHPDLAGVSVAATYNILTGGTAVADDNSHGTHVMGTIAARTNNGVGVAGIAPGVSVMPIKALDKNGYGYWSDFLEGVDWAVAHGAKIVNMSLGGYLSSSQANVYRTTFDNAYAHGVTVVAAAGNDHTSSLFYPADFDHVIAVAATDNSDAAATFSNYNDRVDVSAPGTSILSTIPGGLPASNPRCSTPCYYRFSGTSMATPHVAAIAALRLSTHPGENPDQVEQALEQSSVDLGAAGRDPYFGWGRVDAAAAIAYQPPALPVAGILPLPATAAKATFPVRWDGVAAAGVATYDVQVSVDGGAFGAWLTGTTATTASYAGAAGHGYAFRVRAHDRAGHTSAYDVASVWRTTVQIAAGGFAAPVAGDVRLRAEANLSGLVVRTLSAGQIVAIVDGPVASGGYAWYKIETPITAWSPIRGVTTGWAAFGAGWFTAAHAPNTTFVPVPPPPPSPAPTASPSTTPSATPKPTPTPAPTPKPVPVTAAFSYPVPGTITTSTATTVTWSESGPVTSRTVAEEAAAVTTPGSCSGLTWKAVWIRTAATTPLAVTSLTPGYCYRWRLVVASTTGTSASTLSPAILISPPPTAIFSVPKPGTTKVSYSTTNAISWTTAGKSYGMTITEQVGYTRYASSCTSVLWTTAWTWSNKSSPLTLVGFRRGYCYRWSITLTSASGQKVKVTSGNLMIHR